VIEIPQQTDPLVAIFVATSGHSGVDRLIQHLVPAIARRGYAVDMLKIQDHGPNLEELPRGVRLIELGTRHVYASFPALIRYLKHCCPIVMLTDKDRVNRTAILARAWARVATRLVVRSGVTISVDLAHRGPFERLLQRSSMGRLYRWADKVIVPSQGVAKNMADYTDLPIDFIEVVPSPVVPESLFHQPQPRPDHPWFQPGEPPVVLGVGELGARKDFATLVRAFAIVRRQRPCRLVILGRGKLREELILLSKELGVHRDVDLPGFKSTPYRYMAHAAVFAFTSLWEGNPFVLPEALAVGTPVVATDCPSGPREVLRNGRYGHLVAVRDVKALAEAILKTLQAPLSADTLREAARPYEIECSTTAYLKAMGLDPREPHASSFQEASSNA
jgi:glycosyltransferase involved in cell wall biosynthesis